MGRQVGSGARGVPGQTFRRVEERERREQKPGGDTPQGLTDMAGNVWEWCSDTREGMRASRMPPSLDRYHFQGDSWRQSFVLRGGSWVIDFPNGLRTSFRSFTSAPGLRYNVYGFRIVRR